MRRVSRWAVSAGALAATLVSAPPTRGAVTPEESLVLDRWEIQLGGLATGLDTEVRFDGVIPGTGTSVNLEDDLGYDNNELAFRIGVGRHIGRRHLVEFDFLEIDRTGFTTLEREIQWGEETFPIGADVVSSYDADFLGISYTYWVRSKERSAWGPLVGLFLFSTGTDLALRSQGSGISTQSDFAIDVPIPQFGINYRLYLGKKWVFLANAVFVAFEEFDDFSGDVITARAVFENRTWKKAGFGAGLNLRDFDIDSGEKRLLGKYKFEIRGLYFYARFGF